MPAREAPISRCLPSILAALRRHSRAPRREPEILCRIISRFRARFALWSDRGSIPVRLRLLAGLHQFKTLFDLAEHCREVSAFTWRETGEDLPFLAQQAWD